MVIIGRCESRQSNGIVTQYPRLEVNNDGTILNNDCTSFCGACPLVRGERIDTSSPPVLELPSEEFSPPG